MLVIGCILIVAIALGVAGLAIYPAYYTAGNMKLGSTFWVPYDSIGIAGEIGPETGWQAEVHSTLDKNILVSPIYLPLHELLAWLKICLPRKWQDAYLFYLSDYNFDVKVVAHDYELRSRAQLLKVLDVRSKQVWFDGLKIDDEIVVT